MKRNTLYNNELVTIIDVTDQAFTIQYTNKGNFETLPIESLKHITIQDVHHWLTSKYTLVLAIITNIMIMALTVQFAIDSF
jgi:hypothetical protein